MAQKGFGRRHSVLPGAAQAGGSGQATGAQPAASRLGSAAGRSILAFVAVIAIGAGGAFALSSAFNAAAKVYHRPAAAVERECRVGEKCTNKYAVRMTCGANEEPKSIRVVAADAEAAQQKAERYNRGCRVRGVSFVSRVMKNVATHVFRNRSRVEVRDTRPSGGRRWRFRFRRR
jgi:hypothetical protein